MNINKFLLILLICFQAFSVNLFADETKEASLDDEELPAIDPFQSSSGISSSQNSEADASSFSSGSGILGGLRLVGTILGENTKIAVLTTQEGIVQNFKEDTFINEKIYLDTVAIDYVIIQNEEGKLFEVYYNNIIKPSEG